MTARRAAVVLAAALVGGSPRARAAEVTVVAGVRVATPTCPIAPLSVPAFIDSLRVELADRARAPQSLVVTLAIEPCDPATTRVRVSVVGDSTGADASRDIGLEDIAVEARPRALALAVAELVRTRQPPVAPPPVVVVAPSPSAASRTALAAAGDAIVSSFPSRATTLWGARLTLLVDHARWRLGVLGEAAAGGRDYDVGRVALQSFGVGLVAGPRWTTGRLTLCPGLAGALAWARIEGTAGASDVVAGSGSALTAAVRAHVDASARVGRQLSLRALVEAGTMVRAFSATVDAAPAAGVSGISILVGLGLGLGSGP